MAAIRWFEDNYMILNTDKYHLIASNYKHGQVLVNIGKDLLYESNDVKVFGIAINRDIKFHRYFLRLCSKANQKLSALFRIATLLYLN